MGMFESMAADVAQIKQMLEAMQSPAGAAKPAEAAGETAAQKKAREKKEAAAAAAAAEEGKSDFTAEDVRGRFLAIQSAHGDDVAKSAIGALGYKKLAEVIADAENWDTIMEKSASILETGETDDDNGGL